MSDPTRHQPPTYEQWIDTHRLDYGDLEALYTYQSPARRRAARRESLKIT